MRFLPWKLNLPKNPQFARTEEEYAATGAYETVSALTAKTCPTLSSTDVARWIENTIKPASKIKPKPKVHGKHRDNDTKLRSLRELNSAKIVFCGRTFEFQTATGTTQHGFAHDPFADTTVIIR